MKKLTDRFLLLGLTLWLAFSSHLSAKPRPPLPPLPEAGVLWQWRCDEAGQWYPLRGAPLEAANISFAESWSGYALRMSSLTPALLRFPVVDTDGRTNLNCQVGSVRFWFKPDWSSQSLGGKGPGGWARLIEVGAFTDDARFGWWSLHLSPEGDTIHFRAQTGGKTVEYLRADIAWEQGQWHEIALAYDAQSSVIYLDGKPIAQGAGVTLVPGTKALDTLGFAIGSDMAGENLAQGEFDELKTYRHPLASAQVGWIYEGNARQAALGPVSPEEEFLTLLRIESFLSGGMMAMSSPPPPPGGGGGGTNEPWAGTNSFSSSNLHLGPPLWTNGNLMMSYGGGDTNRPPYDLFTVTNFPPLTNYANDLVWSWVYRTAQGQTNWTLPSVPYPQAFFLLAGIADSDGDGLTDAFERLVSKTLTNSVDTDSDGMPDGWEVANGFNPRTNDAAGDLDGDGISNLQEYLYQMNASRPMEPLGPSSRRTPLVISEIMYRPASGTEFIEIYNTHHLPQKLDGYTLFDPDFGEFGRAYYRFGLGTTIPPGGFLAVTPTNSGGLADLGATIQLRNALGAVILEVEYSASAPWPTEADQAGHSLVLARASFGEKDPRAWAASEWIGGSRGFNETNAFDPLRFVKINEFLANPPSGGNDFIELYNSSSWSIDVSQCVLSDTPSNLPRYRIPQGTVIAARGFARFYDTNFVTWGLSQNGEKILFSNPAANRVLDAVVFGPQENSVSAGRYPDGAPSFRPLSSSTPGTANGPPMARNIVISEIMFNPISGNNNDEFVEIHNRGTTNQSLSGWTLAGGITLNSFGSVTNLAPGQFVVVAESYTNLAARYPGQLTNGVNLVGANYQGNLRNSSERVALLNGSGAIIDEVTYADGGRWGQWADGGGSSLEKIDPRADGRLAPNWADSDETAKGMWTNITLTGMMDNPGYAANTNSTALHLLAFDSGEYVVDDVDVHGTNGVNLIANGTFSSGLTDWFLQGNHVPSGHLTNGGFNGTGGLLVRTSGRGEPYANRVHGRFSGGTSLSNGSTATISVRARWRRGSTNLLARLQGNLLESVLRLPIPSNLGTPGTANSQYRTNGGAAIYAVGHSPVLPVANQIVLITAHAHDPDGVTNLVLRYRIDPLTNLTAAPMNDAGTNGDAIAGDGIYSAKIPGQAAGTLVAFRIEATDTLSAQTRFPVAQAMYPGDVEQRECLVRFGDPVATGTFGVNRIWMTKATHAAWTNRNVLSNHPLDVTLLYGANRVIYNASAWYSGAFSSAVPYNSPTGNICAYSVSFPADDLLLGADEANLDWPPWDRTGQPDQVSHWISSQMGLPLMHRRYVHLFVNGVAASQRGLGTGLFTNSTKVFEDTQQPNGDFLEQWFPGADEGDLFKLDAWTESTPAGGAFPSIANFVTTGGVKKQARYRWNWRQRGGSSGDDYSGLYALMDALLSQTNYTQQVEANLDVEQWMRVFALEDAIGNGDCFGNQYGKNMYCYRPPGDKWKLIPWDLDATVGNTINGWGATNQPLFQTDDDAVARMNTNAPWQRAYWRAVQDLVNGPMLSSQANPIIDGNHQALSANGIVAGTTNAPVTQADADALKTYLSGRRGFMAGELAKVSAPFSITNNNGSNFTTNASSVVLGGKAPMEVAYIRINSTSSNAPVTWNTVTNWTVSVALTSGTNALTVRGYDRLNVSNAVATITITRQP